MLCQKPLFIGQSPITTDLYWKLGGYTRELINNNDWDFWIKVYEKKIEIRHSIWINKKKEISS